MLHLEEYKMEPNGQECFTTGELEECSRVLHIVFSECYNGEAHDSSFLIAGTAEQ